ncbi:hypothetical protein ACFRMN_15900 [Streptomyces sp. NPDC056835]|uniref:hypothetical protein n=1 Tax=Streptomyces sp. NPDC056835 TaxID=3345956 RepID=UPI00368F79B1
MPSSTSAKNTSSMRERDLTGEAEQTRARIDELTVRLRELDEGLEHLRITRKTLIDLAPGQAPQPAAQVPDHPAYQQILAVFTDADRPLRARDICQALDLPIIVKNTEGIRWKLKRLVTRGILTESAPACSPSRPGEATVNPVRRP